MTFLFEPRHIDYIFAAPDAEVTFRPAVEQFTQRVFGLTSKVFFPLHSKMLTELRHLLVPGTLEEHMRALGTRTLELMPYYVRHDQVDLYGLCRGLVFHAAVDVLFGRRFLDSLDGGGEGGQREQGEPEGGKGAAGRGGGPDGAGSGGGGRHPRPPAGVQRLARAFWEFEEGFELAASPVPHFLQPRWLAARAALLRALGAADARGCFAGTVAGQLLDRTSGLPASLRPNLLLAVLWASQANTVPATFWAVGFLLLPQHAAHKEAVLAELQAEMRAGASTSAPHGNGHRNGSEGSKAAASPSGAADAAARVAAAARLAASRRSAVGRCVAEAVRLRVQSIDIRQAAAHLDLPHSGSGAGGGIASGADGGGGRLRLPRGRLLAVCPFESHHDEAVYGAGAAGGGSGSGAWEFDPDRPEAKLGEGAGVVTSVAGLAFGGGTYRCPGRFFAEQELALLVQLLLSSYDMQLSYADRRPTGQPQPQPAPPSPARQKGPPPQLQLVPPSPQVPARAVLLQSARSLPVPTDVEPQPQLSAVRGGSFLYGILEALVGGEALAWGTGWFDGLDGQPQDWRQSGDPSGLLPPCELRRLVGVKVPRKPCWVQLGPAQGRRV